MRKSQNLTAEQHGFTRIKKGMCSISLGFGGTPNRNDDEFRKMIIARNGYKSR